MSLREARLLLRRQSARIQAARAALNERTMDDPQEQSACEKYCVPGRCPCVEPPK